MKHSFVKVIPFWSNFLKISLTSVLLKDQLLAFIVETVTSLSYYSLDLDPHFLCSGHHWTPWILIPVSSSLGQRGWIYQSVPLWETSASFVGALGYFLSSLTNTSLLTFPRRSQDLSILPWFLACASKKTSGHPPTPNVTPTTVIKSWPCGFRVKEMSSS